jgi:hypothetical protein
MTEGFYVALWAKCADQGDSAKDEVYRIDDNLLSVKGSPGS